MKQLSLDQAIYLQTQVRDNIWAIYQNNYHIDDLLGSRDPFNATKEFLDTIIKNDLLKLIFYFDGQNFDEKIPTTVFPLLYGTQKSINRIYATIKYGDPNKRLSDRDKELTLVKYDFYTGSNGFISNLQDAILGAMTEFAKKHPNITTVAVVTAILGYFGSGYIYDYFDDRAKETYLLETQKQNAQSKKDDESFVLNVLEKEQENIKTLKSITDRFPAAHIIKSETEDTARELHKVAQSAQVTAASGIIIDHHTADLLAKQSREKSNSNRIEEVAYITKYDFNNPQDDYAEIKIAKTGESIKAKIDKMALSKEDLLELYKASSDRKPVMLALQVRKNSKSIQDAVIVHFFAGK